MGHCYSSFQGGGESVRGDRVMEHEFDDEGYCIYCGLHEDEADTDECDEEDTECELFLHRI